MKNAKKEIRKVICALLTMAMLCSDVGVTAYAAYPAEQQDILTEAVEDENTSTEDTDPEGDAADGEKTEAPSQEDGQTQETPAEGITTEGKNGETASDPKTEEMEELAEEDGAPEENPNGSDGAEDEKPALGAEDSVSENDLEELEENTRMVQALEDDVIASGEYTENGSDTRWWIDADGKLTVEGTGDFGDTENDFGTRRVPWYDQNISIMSAEINVIGMTDASYMFYGCSNLVSVDVSGFDSSQVTDMTAMFYGCSSLASLEVKGFDTSKVTSISNMFRNCSSLTNLDLSNFDISKVTATSFMFDGCRNLNKLEVSSFETRQVTSMNNMFRDCENLTNLDVSSFDTSQVTTMREIFSGCNALTSLDVSGFDTSQVTDMFCMFSGCSSLSNLDVSHFNVSQVGNMAGMFSGCSSLSNLNVSHFDTSHVSWINGMFSGCSGLSNLDVSGFDTSQVIHMAGMFSGCSGLSNLDVSGFNTSKVRTMWDMFSGCSGLKNLDVSGFDTSQVTGATGVFGMFHDCSSLSRLDVSHFDTSKVTDMNNMFSGCGSLTTLDLGSFDASQVTSADDMLLGCNTLQTIHTPCNLKLSVELPTVTWYQTNGTKIVELPQNLGYSILIKKNEIPIISALKVMKMKTSYVCEDALNLDDITVMYYDAGGMVHQLTSSDYTTNADTIDMSTAGKKILTIIYNNGTTILTETIELTVTKKKPNEPSVLPIDIAVPVANPESGRQLTVGAEITLACETAGAEIYYTINSKEKDLTEPTEDSLKYMNPIIINEDVYIKAVAIKDSSRSRVITLRYTVTKGEGQVIKPYADPVQGVVTEGTKITLACDTPDAVIYYTTGANADVLGAVPVDEDHKYTQPIEITKDAAIKAVAKKNGMKDSDAAVFVYRVSTPVSAPAADPASGAVDQGSYIALLADSDVNIYYTTDTSDPVLSGTAKLYGGRIRVKGEAGSVIVIRAAAERKGVYSETVTYTYTVSGTKAQGLQVMLAGGEEYIYTGRAITPAVIVTNNGEELTEGEDYTVRYSNNVKAADQSARKAPKITVTGKGNLTKSRSITFTIKPKDIGDEEEVVGGGIVAVSGKTAAPVLFYGGAQLTAKDFVNPNGRKKYESDETITITGKGNFEGTRDIDVRVVQKEEMKKFTVVIDNQALKEKPLVYDGEEKTLDGYFEVFDTQDKSKSDPLEEYSDYAVIYPKNNTDAGKVKFTVVGLGEYYGTVTKSYTIKPRAVKTEADGDMTVNVENGDSYPFKAGGVVIPDLTVACDGDILVPGKDYKVSYSGNKKICTNSSAKCTISFKGNYKGSKSIVRKFNISAVVLDDVDQITESVSVAVGDKAYTGKRGAYKSIPYVTVNGVLLKSSDYKVSYYKDQDRTQVIDGRTASGSVDLTEQDSQTVYVKIEGKGNYEGVLTAEYNVYKPAEGVIDLTKAKVNFVGGNKVVYTGEGVGPDIEILYKEGKKWEKIDANDIGTYVTVTYINNVNKGKATVMINGSGGRYVGSKTAVFNIVAKSINY